MNSRFGQGYHRVFREGCMTLGLNFPIESYPNNPVPRMEGQIELAQRAEAAGFAALWSRDVPLLDPTFGDAGQTYDPWVWLGYVAAQTNKIALGTGAIILPLRQPYDVAKAAASVDVLSIGRLILGVASGDRPVEYTVYDADFEARGLTFTNAIEVIRASTSVPPEWNPRGAGLSGQLHVLPKAHSGALPIFVTGHSRQPREWIAANADDWLMYPQPIAAQTRVLEEWRRILTEAGQGWKPFSQSLYVDLIADENASPVPIHLGYRLGRSALLKHLDASRDIGVNHITFNLRFSSRPIPEVLEDLERHILPSFKSLNHTPATSEDLLDDISRN